MGPQPRRGRPVLGAKLVDSLTGSPHAKQRLRLMLGTVAGQITVEQACAELNICQAAFFKLRTRTLQEMVEGLEPRQVGRPPQPVAPDQQRIEELTAHIGQLEIQLQAARIREDLALAGLAPQKPRARKEVSSATTPPTPDDAIHPADSAGALAREAPAGPMEQKKTS